jgi:hypothetical protein
MFSIVVMNIVAPFITTKSFGYYSARVFVPSKHFQPSLAFVSKVGGATDRLGFWPNLKY